MAHFSLDPGSGNAQDYTYVSIQDISGIDPHPFPNKDIIAAFMQWLREVDNATRMNVVGAIALEHQVSLHINTMTEQGQLESLNMQRDDLIMLLVRALAEVSYRDPENVHSKVYAEIKDIYKKLEEWHCILPSYVVYVFLKTMEYFVGRVSDVGEGFFRIIETGQKSLVTFREHAIEIIMALPEEKRAEFQTMVRNSLKGTEYEI